MTWQTVWHTARKLLLLLLCTYSFFAIYFVYDVVGALAPVLEDEFDVGAEVIGNLYLVYSISAPGMMLVSGVLADKYGTDRISVVLSAVMTAGTAIMVVASYHKNLPIFYLGRFFSGFSESLFVVQTTITCENFEPRWLNVALALTQVVGQFGNATAFFVLPLLHSSGASLPWLVSSGFFVSVASLITGVVYYVLVRTSLRNKMNPDKHSYIDAEPQPNSKMKLRDITELNFAFYCLIGVNATSTCSIFVTMSFGPLYLTETGYSESTAGLVIALMNVAVIVAPPINWLLDITGKRVWMWLTTSLLIVIAYLILAIDVFPAAAVLLAIGLIFSALNSSVMAAIPMVVQPKILGTAYAIYGVMFNIPLMLLPLGIGFAKSSTDSWTLPLLIFFIINLLGFLFVVALKVYDHYENNGVLSKPLDKTQS